MTMMSVVVSMVVSSFTLVHDTPLSLLPQNLFYLTDLFLNFSGYLFSGAFGFQLRIIAEFSGDLLELPLYFVKLCLPPDLSCWISWYSSYKVLN